MTSIQFTESDRDDRGFVKAPARSLADLLPAQPTPDAQPTKKPITRQELISAGLVALLLLMALLYISSGQPEKRAPVLPQATAMIAAAPAPAHPTPVATVAPIAMLDAFAAPDGVRLGAIEATRVITPVAHFGADWIQADVTGSGRIWLRKRDWPALAITGADLEPRAPIYVAAPQTGQGMTLDQDSTVNAAETTATPAPSYIDTVGAQAPHSPRGGLCGPTGGDCAPVPTAAPDMLVVIGQQAPHKIR